MNTQTRQALADSTTSSNTTKRIVTSIGDVDLSRTVYSKAKGEREYTFKPCKEMDVDNGGDGRVKVLSDSQVRTITMLLTRPLNKPEVWQVDAQVAPVAANARNTTSLRDARVADATVADLGYCPRCRADGMRQAITAANAVHTCAKLKGQGTVDTHVGVVSVKATPAAPVSVDSLLEDMAAVLTPSAQVQAIAAQGGVVFGGFTDGPRMNGADDNTKAPAVDARAGLGDWVSPGMDDDARTRVMANESAARDAGFALRDTLYARGRLVNRVGVDNARAERAAWDAKPRVPAEMARLRGIVAGEAREDLEVPVDTLRMDPGGYLVTTVAMDKARHLTDRLERLAIEREALAQVFQRVAVAADVSSPGGNMENWTTPRLLPARVGAFNALAEETADRHAAAVARFAATPERVKRADKLRAPERPMMVIRTRKDDGGVRGVFAGVSPRYAACDADKLATACEAVAGASDLRADVSYDGRRLSITMLAHSNVAPERCAVGEAFQYGIRLETSDTGHGGVNVSGILWRNLCENYIIIDQSVLKIASLRHIGDPVRLAKDVQAALAKAHEKGLAIFGAWDKGTQRVLLGRDIRITPSTDKVRAERGHDELFADLLRKHQANQSATAIRDEILAGMFRGLVHSKVLPAGLRTIDTGDDSDLLGMLLAAHDHQRNAGAATVNGVSIASLANAASYYGHAMQNDPWVETDMERAAGEILSLRGAVPWMGHPDKVALA
jgi:hypothetical protein